MLFLCLEGAAAAGRTSWREGAGNASSPDRQEGVGVFFFFTGHSGGNSQTLYSDFFIITHIFLWGMKISLCLTCNLVKHFKNVEYACVHFHVDIHGVFILCHVSSKLTQPLAVSELTGANSFRCYGDVGMKLTCH